MEDGTGNTQGPPTDEDRQCSTPAARKAWNRDAAAREAARRIVIEAFNRYQETDLFRREYGALLCEMSPGVIDIGPIREGPFVGPPIGGRGTVDIPVTDCGAGVPVGFIHSHTTMNVLPSEGDFGYLAYLAYQSGVTSSSLSVYTLGTLTDGTQTRTGLTHAPYSDAIASQQEGYVPEWVDPNATPCPEE